MKESVTYQAIIEEGEAKGRLEELRKVLLLLGGKQFGPPSPAVRTAIESAADLDRLERMTERLLEAENWDELLATP